MTTPLPPTEKRWTLHLSKDIHHKDHLAKSCLRPHEGHYDHLVVVPEVALREAQRWEDNWHQRYLDKCAEKQTTDAKLAAAQQEIERLGYQLGQANHFASVTEAREVLAQARAEKLAEVVGLQDRLLVCYRVNDNKRAPGIIDKLEKAQTALTALADDSAKGEKKP